MGSNITTVLGLSTRIFQAAPAMSHAAPAMSHVAHFADDNQQFPTT
jgi:hypothetical protein